MLRRSNQKPDFKDLFGILVVASLLASLCIARGSQSVSLGWNASSASTVAGYALYYGAASHNFTNRIDVGANTQVTVSGLKEGLTYYFAITSYNAARIESPPSGQIVYLVPGILTYAPPTNFANPLNMRFPVVPGHWYEIEASVDLKSWTTIWQMSTATSNTWVGFQDPQSSAFPRRFYRLAGHSSAVLPPPILRSVTQTGPNVNFAWSAQVGQSYQVQYAPTTNPVSWNNLGGVVTAAGAAESVSYAVGAGSHWSYRVVLASAPPPPVFQPATESDGMIMLTWSTVPGQMYRLQYTRSLTRPVWNNLGGVINALGTTATAADLVGLDQQRFYRAELVGPLPPPVIESVVKSNGLIVLTWNSVAGQTYQVQYTPSLTQPSWSDLGGTVTAYGPTATATDVIGPDPQRFYRVALLPTLSAPVIQSVVQTSGMIQFTWNTVPGQTYQVQYTPNLDQPYWYNLDSPVIASGLTLSAFDFTGPAPQKFYRVIRYP